jgi:type IV secretion system protein VirB1
MEAVSFIALVTACAPLVDLATAQALVGVESAFNPHAIGVVHGVLERQPRNRREALATARQLGAGGWNFSAGLAQINVRNFARLGLDAESAFDPCINLGAMQTLLQECFEKARLRGAHVQGALRQSFSCYYSGNFVSGFRDGYVRKIVQAASRFYSLPLLRTAKESS